MAANTAWGKVFVTRDEPSQAVAICEALHAEGLQAEPTSSVRAVTEDATEIGPACFVADSDSLAETPSKLPPDLGGPSSVVAESRSSEKLDESLTVISLSEARRRADAAASGAVHVIDPNRGIGPLADSVKTALACDATQVSTTERRQDLDQRIRRLSFRDREVMRLIYDEYPNKAIASELDISQRTVEGIRAKIFRVLGVATGIGLARLLAESRYFGGGNRGRAE